jgi:hypothetical protein
MDEGWKFEDIERDTNPNSSSLSSQLLVPLLTFLSLLPFQMPLDMGVWVLHLRDLLVVRSLLIWSLDTPFETCWLLCVNWKELSFCLSCWSSSSSTALSDLLCLHNSLCTFYHSHWLSSLLMPFLFEGEMLPCWFVNKKATESLHPQGCYCCWCYWCYCLPNLSLFLSWGKLFVVLGIGWVKRDESCTLPRWLDPFQWGGTWRQIFWSVCISILLSLDLKEDLQISLDFWV